MAELNKFLLTALCGAAFVTVFRWIHIILREHRTEFVQRCYLRPPTNGEYYMKEKKKILIAGGDLRQIYSAVRLSDKYEASVIGFDEEYLTQAPGLHRADMSEEKAYDYALLPVPPLDDQNVLNTPCGSCEIRAEEIKKLLRPDGIIFAGRVDRKTAAFFSDFKVYDYMEREDLSLLNAIPTAEGAVQLAMEELPVTLSGLKVLIVGMGRIGTALAGILKGFGSDVTVAVRNAQGTAKARISGIKSCCTAEMSTDYALVFNTVPSLIFNRDLLKKFSGDTLFIDLASKPGGIDFEAAAQLGIKAVWALGLPGKTAPITSGEIIADTVSCILSERGEAYG